MGQEGAAELSLDQLLDVDRQIRRAFRQFLVVLGLKIVAGITVMSVYDPSAPRLAWPYAVANLVLLVCLVASYVFLAVALVRASIRLGRRHAPVVAWFIALPVILIVLSQLGSGPELGGFGGFIGFVIGNTLYASPAAIWLSLKRDLEHRLDEATSLRSLGH